MTRLITFLICLLLCGCSSVVPKVEQVPTVLNPAQAQPVAMVQYAAPMVVQPPMQTSKTFAWECADSAEHPLGSYFTGLERTASLPPQWEVVSSFPAQASNQCTVVSYTPQAYFRAWTDETNRY